MIPPERRREVEDEVEKKRRGQTHFQNGLGQHVIRLRTIFLLILNYPHFYLILILSHPHLQIMLNLTTSQNHQE